MPESTGAHTRGCIRGVRASPALDLCRDWNGGREQEYRFVDFGAPSRFAALSPPNLVQLSDWDLLKNAGGLRPLRCAGVPGLMGRPQRLPPDHASNRSPRRSTTCAA